MAAVSFLALIERAYVHSFFKFALSSTSNHPPLRLLSFGVTSPCSHLNSFDHVDHTPTPDSATLTPAASFHNPISKSPQTTLPLVWCSRSATRPVGAATAQRFGPSLHSLGACVCTCACIGDEPVIEIHLYFNSCEADAILNAHGPGGPWATGAIPTPTQPQVPEWGAL